VERVPVGDAGYHLVAHRHQLRRARRRILMSMQTVTGIPELAADFVTEIGHNYGRGRTIVAVDGLVDTGRFADALAEAFDRAGRAGVRARILDFARPRQAWFDPERPGRSLYESGLDAAAVRAALITPFRRGEPFSTALSTSQAMDATEQLEPDPNAVLIIDGPF